MEKVKTCTFEKETGQYKIYKVELESGKQATAFEELQPGDEVEVTEKEYRGEKQYNCKKPKSKGKFPAKDWTFEKKRSALENAVKFSQGKEVKSNEVLQVADAFFNWLKQ